MVFNDELKFEKALIEKLFSYGWEHEVLKNKTEAELIQNWANILFENNRDIDRLNDFPLTDGEMQQIMEQIAKLRTPLRLNGFINGKSVSIKRDNPDDKKHFGKEISLKIYDRQEIAAGQSRYQIAEQPQFPTKSHILNDRRGDLMLLINGMPLFHIELKKSGVHVSQATNQIKKYAHEGIFTGLFSLIQVFVAMNPEETLYFANPGPDGKFNEDYFFHWADFNNERINHWQGIAEHLLSIPMAHQLIGFYTVADNTDGILKVMRSYQYYASNALSDKVSKVKWDEKNQYGGYVWHTTGSGKTLTSFKSAQLVANSKDADKVVFLVDRIELGTQSLREYRGFAEDNDSVQATEDTGVLISKLKSIDPADVLIVTSIQKMSRIKEDGSMNDKDIKIINSKRIVFVVDEAHRSTFGEMLSTIKTTLPSAIFFGFTGTPIQEENQKKMNTTSDVFGKELHRYSIADGIRDKNVLGFDPYKVLTYKDNDIRKKVSLMLSKAQNEDEVMQSDEKKQVFFYYMNRSNIPMAGYLNEVEGKYVKGIEDYLPNSQYERIEHREMVVKDILEGWQTLSYGGKFHALFATSSIPEAIQYYELFKSKNTNLNIVALFDQNIDNNGEKALIKEDAIVRMLEDYNRQFNQNYTIATYAKYKKDISSRLAHKEPYISIENDKNKQIDILIVVDQMLTGFDSKWINTLYLDKILRDESIIQAFSRTNRLFGPEKPFGTIKYYRRPHTMERMIDRALKIYSGDKPFGIKVQKLKENLKKMNELFDDIKSLFVNAGIENFQKLPEEQSERAKFAKLFNELNKYLEASKIQGFIWGKTNYSFGKMEMHLDEQTYLILAMRYKELFGGGKGGQPPADVPFEINGYLTEINTGTIDINYMNTRFEKYLKLLHTNNELEKSALSDLHKSFASLTQEEQKFANIFIHDIQRGDIKVESGKTMREYITEYQIKSKNDQMHRFSEAVGINEDALRDFMALNVNVSDINEFGRLDKLKATINIHIAKQYFEKKENQTIPTRKIYIKMDNLLREFVLKGGFEIE